VDEIAYNVKVHVVNVGNKKAQLRLAKVVGRMNVPIQLSGVYSLNLKTSQKHKEI